MIRAIITGAVGLCGVLIATPAPATPRAPNILVIVVDDMNDWVGFAGGQAKTPNLDAAAARGMVFANMQAPATFCTPSRSALMTGSAPWRSGNYRNQPALATTPHLRTFADLLGSAGYAVFGTGKVFHHTAGYLDRRGYREWYLWNPQNRTRGWPLLPWGAGAPTPKRPVTRVPRYTGWPEFDTAELPDELESHMADSRAAAWAADKVGQAHDRPFLMTFGTYAPHKPNFVPKRYFDLYRSAPIRLPLVVPGDVSDLPGDMHKRPLCCVSPVKPTIGSGAWPAHKLIVENGDWGRAVHGYLAAISYADEQIGRVLRALEAGPNRDNTLVVFLSDNGYHLGEKDKWAKHSLWQRTTNIPFFILGPGVKAGRTTAPATLLDIMPTLLTAAGAPVPRWADGHDLTPILRSGLGNSHRRIVTAGNPGEWAVTDARYRYIRYLDGTEELYDRAVDPLEATNLAASGAHARVRRRLAAAIPRNPAREGPSPEVGTLRLVIEGETFRWEAANDPVDAEGGD